MPYRSKREMRWRFAAEKRGEVPKGSAREWAHHTPNIKALPEKAPASDAEKRRRRRRARR